MTEKFQKNISGLAQVQLALLVVVVAAVVGVVAWRVNGNSSSTTTVNKEVQDKCMAIVNDEKMCKFAGAFANATAYKASINASDKSGMSATYDLAYDSNNNVSNVLKENGQEKASMVIHGGITYVKDYTDGQWFKYASGDKNAPESLDLKKEFLKADFKNDKGEKLAYKNLGTEKCDKLTCYKYQENDPQKPGETTYLWIDTKDFLLRRVSVEADSLKTEMSLTYGSVTISAPSPTKDAPVAPAQ